MRELGNGLVALLWRMQIMAFHSPMRLWSVASPTLLVYIHQKQPGFQSVSIALLQTNPSFLIKANSIDMCWAKSTPDKLIKLWFAHSFLAGFEDNPRQYGRPGDGTHWLSVHDTDGQQWWAYSYQSCTITSLFCAKFKHVHISWWI